MNRGFGLIGLLITVAILAIVAWGAYSYYFKSLESLPIQFGNKEGTGSAKFSPDAMLGGARDIARRGDLNQLQSALNMYKAEKGEYPSSLSQLVPDFIGAVPQDPKTKESYTYTPTEKQQRFSLCAGFEDTKDGEATCIHSSF